MATEGWIEFGGRELINLARTAQLALTLGIDSMWIEPDEVQWIDDARAEPDYGNIANAPWYDPNYPASSEFAGLVSLAMAGLDDSTLASTPVEYVTNGGHSGRARHATKSIVASVAILASTERGAEFGRRWLDRRLADTGAGTFCNGGNLRYYRYPSADAPLAHYRDVKVTRGTSVTRKRSSSCSATWLVTFTFTAADPFEYSEPFPVLADLGGVVSGPDILASGSLDLIQQTCPVYDYTPIYDPEHPALVPSPTVPDFYPAGWNIFAGQVFTRYWARISPIEPSALYVVPTILLTGTTEARRVRVSIWPAASDFDDQCDPLFSVIANYVPPDVEFTIDSEQQASYLWDGASAAVRRTDSLVYGPDAQPVEWSAFNDPDSLLVTLDIFDTETGQEGGGTIRAALALTQKSD